MTDTQNRRTDDTWRQRMEDDVVGLSKEMAGFKSTLGSVLHEISNLATKLDRSESKRQDGNKTQWPIVIAALTLVAVVIGGFMSGYVRDLDRVEANAKKTNYEFVNHIKDGHPARVEAGVKNNSSKIADLDEILQREMRLLNNTERANLLSLDVRLQREMVLISDTQNLRDKELERRMGETESWQRNHDQRVVGLNAAQWSRIKSLERQVFGKPSPVEFGKALGSGGMN